MNNYKTILFALVGVLTVIACTKENKKQFVIPSENKEASGIEKSTQENQKTAFHKTLTLQNISFDIKTIGEGSIQRLSIQSIGLEIAGQNIETEIDGQVVNAEIEDLNSDGFPEVLIYTMSSGSGSYGDVIAYSVNNGKSLSQIYFPEINENQEASIGYMGHDEFAVVENTLVRRFPIYKADDPNSKPTGGIRQIQYKLKEGEASRVFVIDKIIEY